MNNPDKILKLEDYRKTILLSEIGALLHDIGKLSKGFLAEKCDEDEKVPDNWIHHSEVFYFDEVSFPTKEFEELNIDMELKLRDIAEGHHEKRWNKSKIEDYSSGKNAPALLKLICIADKFDSEEDKGSVCDKQDFEDIIKITPFGGKKQSISTDKNELTKNRKEIYEKISLFIENEDLKNHSKRKELFDKIKDSLNQGLGETRRAANDVTIWEHTYSSTAIFKALIGEYLLNEEFRGVINKLEGEYKKDVDGEEKWKWNIDGSIKKIIKENNPFKILSIGWDYFEFLSQSQKISDITGRVKAIDDIKKELRKEIEVEFLLGNRIYEDEKGIHFLIPASFENEEEVRVQISDIFNEYVDGILRPKIRYSNEGAFLKEMLPDAIEDVMKADESLISEPEWFSINQKKKREAEKVTKPKNVLICNNCGKGVYIEGNKPKICDTCKNKLRDNKTDKTQTKFVDEIAWNDGEYGNIALITLNFKLKNWLNSLYVDSIYFRKPSENKNEIIELAEYLIWEKIEDSNVMGALNSLSSNCNNEDAWDGISQNIKDKKNYRYFLNLIFDKITEKTSKKIDDNERRNIFDFLDDKEYDEETLNKSLEKLNNVSLKNNFVGKKEANEKTKSIFGKRPNLNLPRNLYTDFNKPDDPKVFYKKFIQKNSSSSRLMRIWSTTNKFNRELDKEIIDEITSENKEEKISRKCFNIESSEVLGWGNSGILDLKIEGEETECVVNLDKEKIEIIDPKINSKIDEETKFIEIKKKTHDNYLSLGKKEIEEFDREIIPYRKLSMSANQFMFLVPASKTDKIMERIKEKYEEELGKVYGKLPLNIGIVFGKRKTPMFSMIDSARRFRENNDDLKEKDEENYNEFEVIDVIGNDEKITLKLKRDDDSFCYKINVPYKLGNGDIDYYHPYLKVKDGEDVLEIEVEDEEDSKTITQKHITKIENDVIKLDEANFDFEFLDSNKRRFDISLNEKDSRTHDIVGEDGPRPYLFEDWQKFNKLKEIFKTIGSWTPIRDIESITADKRIEWMNEKDEFNDEEKEAYEGFVQDVLENKISETVKDDLEWKGDEFDDKSFLVECIMDGTYFDAVELYKTIMNIDLEDEKDE